MQFSVRVETRVPGRLPMGDTLTIDALNEMQAGELAKLEARSKYPGGTPLVRGIRASTAVWSQSWAPPEPVLEGEEPANQDADEQGPRETAQPVRRPFAEWNSMKWFGLKAHAKHASGIEPKDKKEALVMLQERQLIAP